MKKNITLKGQLEFDFEIPKEQDRNFHLEGRSFYFFDFDDNIAYLATPIILFNKMTGEEISISSHEFANESRRIGKSGKFSNYFLDINNDELGSFRFFRDKESVSVQQFVLDIEEAIKLADHLWKAPSWNCFYHATYNQRPVSIITARGHKPDTIKNGIHKIVTEGHLPQDPNYLSIYPVSNKEVRRELLGDLNFKKDIAELKKEAIRLSVEKAIETYGNSPYHRFGMSDDDNKNIELITEEMRIQKRKYPEMSFFVIETFKDSFAKYEILEHETREIISQKVSKSVQLSLF